MDDSMAHVYILKTAKDKYYIGSTANFVDRISKHQKGKVKTTKSALPVSLVYTEQYQTRGEAQKREYEIKSWKSRKRIEALIRIGSVMAPSSNG